MSVKPIIPDQLVSVIIPCFNHGKYLRTSIRSVLRQTYKQVEIVVVDDGSTDNTRRIAQRFTKVKYIYQNNQGLSAARNTGIDYCNGTFLVFLDADDWLMPEAISINIRHLHQNPEAVFVSGAHKKVYKNKIIPEIQKPIGLDPYHQLLHQNYIGMIAAVMFRRGIFDHFCYDVSLKSCEDYDLYLMITRDHPVVHHIEDLARYLIHNNNMSGNKELMLHNVVKVLSRQKEYLRGEVEEQYLNAGLENWQQYYCKE